MGPRLSGLASMSSLAPRRVTSTCRWPSASPCLFRNGTNPARLPGMAEGRSKQAFKTWLGDREQHWRDRIEVIAMDGFTGFKTATNEDLPDATAVIDPLGVVRLAGEALDGCRRQVQHELHDRLTAVLMMTTSKERPRWASTNP